MEGLQGGFVPDVQNRIAQGIRDAGKAGLQDVENGFLKGELASEKQPLLLSFLFSFLVAQLVAQLVAVLTQTFGKSHGSGSGFRVGETPDFRFEGFSVNVGGQNVAEDTIKHFARGPKDEFLVPDRIVE